MLLVTDTGTLTQLVGFIELLNCNTHRVVQGCVCEGRSDSVRIEFLNRSAAKERRIEITAAAESKTCRLGQARSGEDSPAALTSAPPCRLVTIDCMRRDRQNMTAQPRTG